ncbi:CAP-Gly domain-containing linker protein 1-like [Rhopalosiphum maidis]|uniref:CAP-Gly domain-containing linker protein 1-like n=1 Tax=Rhopalosiphum maidis TaxID=43146 RepID=UPI000F00C924|nr:CAP-Gly domain-containing linker protein 1-like [Rhopalosiphum maidis]
MSENSENKEIKTSGLRPPTKIPTMGVSRLPSSSSIKLDGVSSNATRLDGGSSVKKSTDMAYVSKHNGFNKKPTDERKLSSGSDSFIGDARRLSEAGVRRSSGNSVVLTEDTDKFIIGNRIWVGGTKPGQIAYIGETNFGNGDWAGVVLDEPIGKNDGSVSGTRYFQCEPKKGIFARLTNLTSAPLSSVEDSMVQNSFAATKPLGFSTPMPKRQGSTVTATKAAPKSISQTPIVKSSSDLKIGDRVIISSGQGSKLGVLRYRGATQFAPGEWCGIELDDPLGKNNGTVEGIKYFECEDKFGLFTPITKVSKSPMSASRMSTNCAIHKAKRSPGSMNGSMVSGITTNTMSSIPTRPLKVSDMDRLKLQLTQMKNENELLRSQVIKAANQADVAEKRLEETLKAQSEQPSEIQVNGIIMLQNQLDNIKKQIDDEKEKVQNLQFTNEEQNVVNIELQNKNAELLIKIKELELDLTKERNLAKDIEKETMKIFEKEEELCRVKEELETLKKLIDNNEDELQKSVSNLSSEVVDKEAILNTLRQTLNENSQNHERLLKEANENLSATTERLTKIIEEKEKKIEQNQEMIDQLNEGIKCLSALKNEEHDDIVNSLKNELSKLKNEYQVIIDEKEQCMKITQENHIKIENEFKQELKSLSENKNQEIQHLQQKNLEKLEKLENINQNINMELKAALKSIQDQTNDIANLEKKYSDLELQQDLNKNELEKELTTKLKTIENELTFLRSEKSILEEKHENYVKEATNTTNVLENKLKQNNILIENLKKTLNELTLSKQNELDSMKKQILQLEGERDNLLKCQSLELATKDELINTLSNKLELTLTEKQKQDLSNANLQTELTNETLKYQTTIKDLQNKINELEANIASNYKSFKSELELLSNEKLASESENLNLLEKLKFLENLKLNLEEKLVSNEICIQDIQNLNEVIKEKNKIIDDSQIKIKELDNFVTQTKNEYGVILKEKEKEIKELLKIGEEKMKLEKLSLEEKTKVILDEKDKENSILHKKIADLENIKQDLEKQLEMCKLHEQDLTQLNEIIQDKIKTIKDNDLNIEQLNNKIALCKEEFNSELKEKENKINELIKVGEEKLINEKKQIEEQNKVLLDKKDEEISNLMEKLNILESSKTNFEQQLIETSKKQENIIAELKISIEEKTNLINDNNLNIEQLNNKIVLCKEEFNSELKEKENKINELIKVGEEKLINEKIQIEEQNKVLLDKKDEEISNLMEKLNILESSKTNFEQQLIETSKKQENIIAELKISIEEKTNLINDNNLNIEQLNNKIVLCKEEFNSELKEKENKINELIKVGDEKLINEKIQIEEQNKVLLDKKDEEISNLMEKLNILESSKTNFEQQLIETSKKQENIIAELKISIEEKTNLINDNNLNIEQLNNKIVLCKEEFNSELKKKEDQIKELIKVGEEKLLHEKLELEKHAMHTLDEKNKEISNLIEKLNILDNSKSNLEKQLEISKTQEHDIIELKKDVQEKTKIIDDKNSKVEVLNSLIAQTKEDFSMRLKEKENEVHELVKTIEHKLNAEKISFDTRIKSCMDEKNTEIKLLKTQLHEFAENNKEKELMLKLESIINELEKEKLRASHLEALKLELEKTVLQHKTELDLLNKSKINMKEEMIKTIEKQQVLNTELTAKTESEQLDSEKLNIQKQIDELQIECSRLRSTLNDKNCEIENLKIQISQELKPVVSCNDELSQLKALLEKSHSAQSHLEFRIQELTDENHRLNERIEVDNNQLHKNDNIMQEKYNIEKKYEETYNILKIKENQILVLQTELNSWKLKDTEKSKNNITHENTDKSEAHLLAEKNQEIKMLNSIILGLHKKLSAVMETDVSEYEIEKNPNSISKEDYQKLYKTAKNNVKLKECENLSLKQEINKLKTENDRYSEFKTKCESLENDKKSLQKLIVSYDNSIPTNVKSDTKSETEKILEEKDWQINLLNNIIADLHAKVSDNKFKIEALETQILDSGVEQNSKKTRLRTTRLYCERCEIFDSHDTEDCPEKPESPKFQRKRRVVNDSSNKMIDEPFCVCCDMFGHTANECDNSLTF